VTAPLSRCGCGGAISDCYLCGGDGYFAAPAPSAPVAAPVKPVSVPLATGELFHLAIARDGWAKDDAGFVYPRWVVCLSRDGSTPASRYRNGGPKSVGGRSSAMKVAPDWQRRAVGYVAAIGGVTAEEAGTVADWYRRNRTGQYPGAVGGGAK
jgi:hypothetical protein